MDELNTDIIEVIFLDVNNNNNENEKADEVCLQLGVKIRNLKVDFKTGGTWGQVGQ